MKKTLLTLTTLALLAGLPALVRAGDTNTPTSSTNTAVKPYPLTYCLVSGEKIGEMGKPAAITYKGQEIKFCCGDCVTDFKKDPDKFLKKLAEEEKKAKK
ncbi:MAG: hypothetical protein ABSH38_07625 [Verrucomicrobiota bacterium]|jgi:YHS domain-containing protein